MVNMNKFIGICIDGWDYEYINYHKMEFISLKKRSFAKPVRSMMPSVTNVNNLSIISGAYPSKHGICSNYNYSKNLNQGTYLEDNKYVMSETIFNICNEKNLTSILATSKNKLKTLLINNNFNNNLSYSTENPSPFLIKKFGEAPSIYTIKANSWTISTASMLIYEKSPDFSYISLTDYPMHKFKPESTHSLEHLKLIDESICELINKNPDYQIFITADHGMSDKTKLVNIENELSKYNIHSAAIPIIKDKHEIHHSNLGGSIYLYLNDLSDLKESKKILKSVVGIEDVLNKSEACQKFNLNSNRIGDLMILGQKNVVFGDSDISLIPNDLRSHASTYETKIPLIGINTTKNPDYFIENRSIGNYIIDSI